MYLYPSRPQNGSALVVVLIIASLLMGMALALTTTVSRQAMATAANQDFLVAFYAAEGGLNQALALLQSGHQLTTDTNGDGTVDTAEKQAAMAQWKAEHKDSDNNPPGMAGGPGPGRS